MALSRVISFTSRNVFTNLAAEERFFDRTSGHNLLFYVNSPCVVLGRTQNPFKEVDVAYAASQQIPVARRRSGGGTVVHDEGNLNICFISPREEHDPHANSKLVARALRDEFGILTTVNKRADVFVDGAKVSGSAYRLSRDRAYHHATLLIKSDLPRLRRLLASPLKDQLDVMGTASISSSVTNLSELGDGNIDIPTAMQAIANRWQGSSDARVQALSPGSVEREFGGLQGERGELCGYPWVFGKTPRFSFRAESNGLALTLFMNKGTTVDRVEISSDSKQQDVSPVEDKLSNLFKGLPFDGPSLSHALDSVPPQVSDDQQHQIIQAVRDVLQIPQQIWRGDSDDVPFESMT